MKDWDLHVEAKSPELKNFINNSARHFIEMGIVPTRDQVYDYITTDRWFKANVYDGARCNLKQRGWSCLSLRDVCDSIQDQCSYVASDLDESIGANKMKLRIRESFDNDDLSILIDKYFDADTYDRTYYHFESGLWTLDAEYRDRLVNVIRYDGNEVAVFGYCGFPKRPIYNGLYANSIPELGYSSKDLRNRIKYLITQHGAEVI